MDNATLANRLSQATAGYSTEAIKASIAESTLNEMQIKAILSKKGLTGNILETTTAELTAITTTNAMTVSEGAATTATSGLSLALKGLGATLAAIAPYLLVLGTAAAILGGAYYFSTADERKIEKTKKEISEITEEMEDAKSKADSYSSKLKDINDKISDLNKLDSLSFTEEQELKNLTNQKIELENLYRIEKARYDLKQKEKENKVREYLNESSTSSFKVKEVKEHKSNEYGAFAGGSWTQTIYDKTTPLEELELATEEMLKQQDIIKQLENDYHNLSDPTKEQTEEYEKKKAEAEKARDNAKDKALEVQEESTNQINGLDSTSESYKKVTEASQKLSDALARLDNDWSALSDNGKIQELSTRILKDSKNIPSEKTLNKFLDGLTSNELDILANITFDENTTIESLKEAIKKAQEESNKDSISVKLDPTSLLEESEDKSKSTTLADLQSEADLLSSIQKELSENGKISTSTMQNIIKQYPEAKDALGKYMQGIISEQELFEELQRLLLMITYV